MKQGFFGGGGRNSKPRDETHARYASPPKTTDYVPRRNVKVSLPSGGGKEITLNAHTPVSTPLTTASPDSAVHVLTFNHPSVLLNVEHVPGCFMSGAGWRFGRRAAGGPPGQGGWRGGGGGGVCGGGGGLH